MRQPLRVALLALVSLLAIGFPAGAQSRVTTPPALPRTISDGRYDVVLLTHGSAAALVERAPMADWFGACRKQHTLPATDSVTVVQSQPWDWNAPAVAEPASLSILVSRASGSLVGCSASPAATAVAVARGFQVSSDTTFPYDASIVSATLRRGDSLVPSMDVERIAATRLTRRGLITIAAGLLRISVPMDAVAPDSSGTAHDVEIEIVAPDAQVPHRLVIPWTLLRPLWEQVLETRARAVAAEFATGAAADAALVRSGAGSKVDRLAAQVRLGDAFVRSGDLPMARVVLGRAVEEEPCLTLAATMPERTRAVVDQVERPRDRCRAHLPLTVVRATLLPGLGRLDGPNRKLLGGALLATVAGTLTLSQSTNASAKDLYAQYRAVDGTDAGLVASRAAALYDQAESKRVMGRSLVMVGVGLWAATIVEAALSEQRLARRLERVQGYSIARHVGVAPVAGPSRVGLALSFF
jgi:hypothetical protein